MKLRLLVLTEIIAPYRIPVFNALARQEGIDLHVVFLAESDPGLRDWLVYRNEIGFSYQVLPSWRRRFAGYSLLVNLGLKRALRQKAPNAILCGGYNYAAAWQAKRWAQNNKVPFILWLESTSRDFRSRRTVVEFLKRRFIQNCRAFVVPGKSSFQYVMSYAAPEEHIFTAPNAVDTELFAGRASTARENAAAQRHQLELPPRYFLFVGRLIAEKGV